MGISHCTEKCSVTRIKENHIATESVTVRVRGILQVNYPTLIVQKRKLRPGDTVGTVGNPQSHPATAR